MAAVLNGEIARVVDIGAPITLTLGTWGSLVRPFVVAGVGTPTVTLQGNAPFTSCVSSTDMCKVFGHSNKPQNTMSCTSAPNQRTIRPPSSRSGTSGSINAENDLGLDSRLTVFRAGAMYRPGESRRNQLDFTYANYKRDGSATLTQDITIDNVTYPIGAQVETVFNFGIINGTYSYAFWQSERARLAFGAGVYVIPLRYQVDIQTTGGNTAVEGADTTLPLPALALRGEFQLISKLFLNASVQGMYLEIDDFKGSLADFNLGIEYRPWKHIGVGVAYNFMGVNVTGESSSSKYPGANFVGEVDVRFNGLSLYGKLSF